MGRAGLSLRRPSSWAKRYICRIADSLRARVALDRAGIPVDTYYACEIDPHAIAVSEKNYPDIVRLGDVRTATLPANIDLLIGGSPCQDLSIAKKDRKGLEGDRSGLFWEYVRILKETQPLFFVLENVASMPQKDRDIITEALGVEPVLFNASLVSAQSRKRLFWTNIPFTLPDDKGILLKDILQPDAEVDPRMIVDGKSFSPSDAQVQNSIDKKQRTLVKVGHIGKGDGQANRVYSPEGKSATLSALGGGSGAKTGLYFVGHLEGTIRKGMEGQEHLSRAHTQPNRVYSPEGKAPTLSATETQGRTHIAIGRDVGRRLNAQGHREDNNKDIPIQRQIELRTDDKSGTLTSVQKDNLVVDETRIRKLTPIECERLQGLPDNYTHGIAITNRYKCLGNAFNADVVAHILLSLHNEGL
jgi:DNA (cytosine-5)-methyltransferase 3A